MSTLEPEPGQIIPNGVTTPEPGASTALTHRQILVILSGLLMGMLLAALDLTIVSTSIRTIADDLDGLSVQAWVTTAYLITSTIATPLYGKLSDLYGRRPFFLLAISLFVFGSLLCALATNMYQLAAFRAFQGLGAGGLFSLALAIVGDIVPPRERARYQGLFLAVFGSSSVLGPLVGGFFAGTDSILGITGWRWVFLINVPLGAIALIVVGRVLHLPHTRRDHRIDFAGAIALSVTLVPLLLVAEQGRDWGWLAGRSIACYAVGVLGFAWFMWAEYRLGDDALLPLRLFRRRTFSIGTTLNFIIGMGMFGGIICLPLYMQIVKGFSPTRSGLSLLPLMVGMMVVAMTSGVITAKTGRYKAFPIIGSGVLIVALLGLSRIHFDTSYGRLIPLMLLLGAGLGCCMQTLVLATQNAVPPSQMGVATSSATFFRSMGGTFGTAVFLTIFFTGAATRVGSNVQAASGTPAFQSALRDPDNSTIARALQAMKTGSTSQLNDTSFLKHGALVLREPFLAGFSGAMDRVFMVAALVVVPAFVLSFFLKEVKLRMESGLEAQAAERRAAAAQAEHAAL
jgi:EmrB/QacA subfamily drug resistance transporter